MRSPEVALRRPGLEPGLALAPPQKELATRRPAPAAAAARRTAAVPDETALTLPSARKLAGGAAALAVTPAPVVPVVAPVVTPEPEHDEEAESGAQAARVSGASDGKPGAASPAKRKEEEADSVRDAREGRAPTAADAEAEAKPEVRGRPSILRRAHGPVVEAERARALAARSAGRSLPAEALSAYAAAWGEDFGSVKVHTDRAAAEAAKLLGAEAFTVGEHVYFGAGRFAPGSEAGRRLLAHELAHVVQLRRGEVAAAGSVSAPDSRAEVQADAFVAKRGVPGAAEIREADTEEADGADVSGAAAAGSAAAETGARSPEAPILRRATDSAKTFFQQGYFQQAAGWSGATTSMDGALGADAAEATAAFPTPTAALGPEPAAERPVVPTATALALSGEVPVPGEADAATALADGESEATAPALPHLGALSVGADGDTSAARARLDGALEDVPTEFDVATTPGPAPDVELTGAADPAQTADQETEARTQAEDLRAQAAAAVDNGPGPEQVQPGSVHEEHPVAVPEAGTIEPLAEIPEMATMVANPIPEDVRAGTDEAGQAQLQATLAETDAALDTASADHDARQAQEVATAQSEQDRLNTEATEAQDEEVGRARGAIDDHRADTRTQQDQALTDLDTRSEEERARVESDIDTRVEADDRAIEARYTQAETDAQAEKDRKESEARAEKERAERESADQSWWESALDAIASFFDALLDAVNAIFDALIAGIGAIIDAAKSAVTAIIDAVRDFAVSLVQAFGELLKGLVQGLLGDIFPGLAAALTELIDAAVDAAVSAINWIADRLKAGILALLDAIGGALTALLEAYRAAITAALAIARAALTGDWAALARMVLEAALNLAGIPPESFYEVMNNAMAALDTILADPGAFVGHVIDAVALGFSNFADNFLTHLQEGFFLWITGPLGELGLQLPATWDLMGIFSLVAQVLGLTQEGIRQVITEELGETAGMIFDHVWRYVGALITGGISGLWAEIQNDLSSLWDMVVDGIKSWLLETIVRQAVIRIATMFNPVGALINAIITVWNVYQWLRENAQRIFGVIRAVVDMIGSIAAGNLTPAAAGVESALASLIPIAIGLLANILGLGGITAKVREVLEGVRETVRNAIRSLIRRVRAMFQGGAAQAPAGEGPPQTDDELGERVPFEGGEGEHEEHHTLYARDEGETGQIYVASTPTPAETWIATMRGRLNTLPAGTPRDTAGDKLNAAETHLNNNKRTVTAAAARPPAGAPVDESPITAAQRTLGRAFAEVLTAFGMDVYPGPIAGLHTVAETATLPNGEIRESHHVPALQLGETIKDELSQSATAIATVVPDATVNASAVALVNQRVAAIDTQVANRGEGKLSAILIHQDTHRTGDNAVHSSDIKGPLERAIAAEEADSGQRRLRILTGLGRELAAAGEHDAEGLSVNPRSGAWRRYLADVAALVHPGAAAPNAPEVDWNALIAAKTTALAAEDADESVALRRRTKSTIDPMLARAYTDALVLGRTGVEQALARSHKDGTPGDHSAALGRLAGLAASSWGPIKNPL